MDGLPLSATGTGGGDINCGGLGTTGSSASGTLGGIPFTVKLATCDATDSFHDVGTYTGQWGGKPVNVTVTVANEQSTPTTTVTGTVGSQNVTGTATSLSEYFVFPDMTDALTITGFITVS